MIKTESQVPHKITLTLLVSISGLLFLQFPLALISPYGSEMGDKVHSFEFFTSSACALLSLSYLVLYPPKNKKIQIFLVSSFLLICLSSYLNGSQLLPSLHLFSYFICPIALCSAFKQSPRFPLWIPLCFLVIINTFTCFFFNQKVGIHGNQNWLSAVIASSSIYLSAYTIALLKKADSKNRKLILSLTIIFILSICILILYKTQTRALIPAFAFFIFYFLLCRFPKQRLQLCFLSLLSFFALFFTFQDKLQRLSLKDIRLPLLKDTAKMISDAPILGHGPGQFITKFSNYPSDELNIRLDSAPIYEHPHNEIFHMASQGGIPLTLLFLALLILILFTSLKEKRFSLPLGLCLILFTLGLLDKTLHHGASLLLFFIFLAQSIKEFIAIKQTSSRSIKKWQFLLAFALLTGFLFPLSQKTLASWHFKKADDHSHTAEPEKLQQALYHLQKAHELDPQEISYAYHCARLEIHLGKLHEAWNKLEPIVNSYPYYNMTLHEQGKLFEKLAYQQNDEASRKHVLKQAYISYESSCLNRSWDLKRYPTIISLSQKYFPESEQKYKTLALERLREKQHYRDQYHTKTSILLNHYLQACENNNDHEIKQTLQTLINGFKLPKDPHWQKFYLDSLK
ncbi:O-antigen ligase family protein [Lentisphaera marina]|uniref:O-antigen ligase family protein n=1 Tax=Lentisphaera marina TaxID=1111041 RepID=UPI0023656078|nr:O-antigen ligase family protein [Lentisphaera marina]MDD7985751.1 O-antigen ligase family protein [Lentisphaera marina]